jgi:hypothetical protein
MPTRVGVAITWNPSGQPTPTPDPVVVKLSDGQKSVQWTSNQKFAITVQDQTIDAALQGNVWIADSRDFDAPNKIPYNITTGDGQVHDPTIDIQT